MMDPVVTLTNFVLTAECWGFALALARAGDRKGPLPWFVALFVALGLGALLGGITHGFVPESAAGAATVFWTGNMLALGGAGAAAAMIAGQIAWPIGQGRGYSISVALLAALYALVVLFVSQDFYVALAGTLVPVLFLLAMLIRLYRQSGRAGVLLAAAGLLVNMAGSVQQQLGWGLDPVWFNHNAVFHLIQMLAFLLIFLGGRPTAAAVSRLRF